MERAINLMREMLAREAGRTGVGTNGGTLTQGKDTPLRLKH